LFFSDAHAQQTAMTILDDITARVRVDLQAKKTQVPQERLERELRDRGPCRDFGAALRARPDAPPRIIAELKRASPSRGLIRADFDVGVLCRELAAHGAAALSVLTEEHFFQGSPSYLREVAATVDVPVLRKDFIVDPYQLLEARAWGADAALLIAAALDPAEFKRLHEQARRLGLAVLAEVHNRDELHMVMEAAPEIVGINSRDLKTFKTDLDLTAAMMRELPDSVVKVAESGIHGYEDIRRLADAGADAFLIGETLMKAPSPGRKLQELLGSA